MNKAIADVNAFIEDCTDFTLGVSGDDEVMLDICSQVPLRHRQLQSLRAVTQCLTVLLKFNMTPESLGKDPIPKW